MQNISLHCLAGPLKDQNFRLRGGPVFIFGRYAKSSFSLAADPAASHLHFLIDTSEGRVRIIDLGSTNGLVINEKHMGGKQGTPFRDFVSLKSGDTILAGACLFRLSIVEESTTFRGGAPDALRNAAGRDKPDAGHLTTIIQKEMSARLAAREREQYLPRQENGLPAIDGYTLLETIADGRGSVVFKAVRDDSGVMSAVKTLNQQGGEMRPALETLLREIAVSRRLRHAHIIRYLGDGVAGGQPYLAIEYIDGGSMGELIESSPGGRLETGQAIPLFLQILEAVAHMHSHSFVHRDINPGNVLLDLRRGGGLAAKLSDLGLSCLFSAAPAGGGPEEFPPIAGGGAPGYMPPERVTDADSALPESDVFSAAATFYHMVAGTPLYDFADRDQNEVIAECRIRPIADLRPDLPGYVADVIAKALSHSPGDRYGNA
ncbi:MAG: protein kinase, partial [Planctomycetota bacterium]|nr:protein kinase [Planctomycetota bacterium]